MKLKTLIPAVVWLFISKVSGQTPDTDHFQPFHPPISYEVADKRADSVLAQLSTDEKIQLINGHKTFFIKGFENHNIPQLYLSDATQGVHIRKELSSMMEKSTAFPCPLALSATWHPKLARKLATCIGEECRVGDIAVLLGPGMNIYRISQCGRNFEYFGEDPFLTARMIENYVVGMQSTGTITTLKHFLCNNTDFHRRNTNSIVDERTLHEIYLPAFKAGIDAGAMAVMTSYNQVNGEWTGQSDDVINKLLRKDLGFKWLVMTDWWSVWDAEKIIKSGQDLEMPGEQFIQKDAQRLLDEGKVKETDINRMAKSVIRTCIAMGLYDRPVKDDTYKAKFPEHEKVALQIARESIVLLKNKDNILPIKKDKVKKILLTGQYVEKLARGLGSAEVEGYNIITMLDAFKNEFGNKLEYAVKPTDSQIKSADIVLVSIGTLDSEGWDRPFSLSPGADSMVMSIASKNPNTVVVVNSGSGVRMTSWEPKVPGIIYSWYVGQNGNTALAEIISGKTNPSGKLPMTIEKKFEDSPGYPYIPKDEDLYTGWKGDVLKKGIIYDITYKEGVFVGYRWYESKKIEPLYHFGHGLSYTTFEYSNMKVSANNLKRAGQLTVEFTVKNTGKMAGAEIAQLYVHDVKASVPRPEKELKGFKKVFLGPGESKLVTLTLTETDFAFWDTKIHNWNTEPGDFNIMAGNASNNILLNATVSFTE
jgi:beta-glucosidase